MLKKLSGKIRESAGVRHLLVAVAILSSVVVAGVAGYMLIEDMNFNQALYMTVITITTVGFREVKPLGTGGQYFTMLIVVTGLGAVLFFLTGLFEFILSEYLGNLWGRRRMQSQIEKLENHYIICGYGRVGSSVALELADQGKPFVVVEIDEDVFAECMREGYLCIHGSATDNDVLEKARVHRAIGLVSALGTDADNLYVVLTARVLNPQALIVARAEHLASEDKLEMVGADRVISPHKIAGKRMANLMLRPRVCEFLDVGITGALPEYHLRAADRRVVDTVRREHPRLTPEGAHRRDHTGDQEERRVGLQRQPAPGHGDEQGRRRHSDRHARAAHPHGGRAVSRQEIGLEGLWRTAR
jgi:voltage-gated potassium channel